MILFPTAKINLGLQIKNKRNDGYHNIQTTMFPIPFHDILEIIPAAEDQYIFTGIKIDSELNQNLCFKAVQLLRNAKDFGSVYLHLHKLIPMGAGLGGGSADAAFVIKGLNELFQLNFDQKELEVFAAELGSDCPFFIENSPKISTGRGELLEQTQIDLSGNYLLLIFPQIHISTSMAYSNARLNSTDQDYQTFLKLGLKEWKNVLHNDFEHHVFEEFPILSHLKSEFYAKGASYAAMSGSGSTMFGIFKNQPKESDFSDYTFKILKL